MSNSKSKKILSLLLTLLMVLSIIPMGVLSASAAGSNDYTLFIDGMVATKNNKDGADVTLSALGITPSGNATDGYVYEFNNVNFETTAGTTIQFNNDATINLVGENTIKGGNSTDEDSNGISAKNLTIQGEGSLTVVVGSTTKAYSNGIKCVGHSLTINGGNLTVTAGNSDIASIGIYCNSFKMTKGNVEVKSGNAEYCYGIWVTSTCILVEGGALNCTSGTASSGKSVAVYAYGGEANARVVDPDSGAVLSYDPTSHCYKKGANIATKATLTVKPEDYKLVLDGLNGYKNSVSETNKLTVDELTALGITASGTAESGYVYEFNNVNFETTAKIAIQFNNDATINLVSENTIKGGDSTDDSTEGIYSEYNLTIQGEGKLTVVSGNGAAFVLGLECNSLNINGGNLNIIAGNSNSMSLGVYCQSFKMTKGNMKAASGNAINCYGISVNEASFLVEGGILNCASGTTSLGESAAVYAPGGLANAKVVDPDDGTELTYDPKTQIYYKNANIATKATLTAKPKEYTLVLDKTNGYKNEVTETNKLTVDELTALGITASDQKAGVFEYTFNNVNFETTAATAIEIKNFARIKLVGDNKVIGGNVTNTNTKGIKAINIAFIGEGSLSVTAGNTTDSYSSTGIECDEFSTCDNVNIDIVSGNTNNQSYGLKCKFFSMDNGNVTIKSGNVSNNDKLYSYAFKCTNAMSMFRGNLNCVAGNVTTSDSNKGSSLGIYTPGLSIFGGKISVSSGTVNNNASSASIALVSLDELTAKVTDTDDGTELEYDSGNRLYKKDETIATKATITANPVDYTLVLDGVNGYKNEVNDTNKLTAYELSTLGITATEPTTGFFEYTFNNVNFETTAYRAIMFNSNATINLVGENTIKGGNSTDLNTSGIFAYSLTIQGEGSLTVVAGNSNLAHSYAIQCSSLNINGGNLKIIAGNSTQTSSGIVCLFFNMTNGEAEIKTGNDCMSCYGLQCSYSFLMEGGNLNCIAGNATSISYGMYLSYFYPVQYKVTGGKITASSGSVTQGTSAAVFSTFELDAKVVVTDDGTVLTYDATSKCYKKDSDIATKATLTAMLCEYNSTKYPTIAKALEVIGTGTESSSAKGSIKLLDNIKEDVTIGQYQEINLDLNGYKLENDNKITLTNEGQLTVFDSSTNKTGEIISNNIAIGNVKTGKLTIKDIKIKVCNEDDAVGIDTIGVCTIQGDKTEITVVSNAYAVAVDNKGTISITGGKFTASGSGDFNSAFCTYTNKVTIGKDAEFILGTSTAMAQAAYYSNENNTISAGKFSGPIVTDSGKTITITGGSFTENPKDMVNSDTHKVVDNGNTVAYRYTVEEKIDTTISAPTTTSKMYDGSALNGAASTAVTTGTTLTYQTKDAADGQYSAESTDVPSLTNAGTLYVKAIARHADYETVSVEYVLTVSKRDITFTSGSANKTVDGSPLTNSQITVSGDGFAGEEGATYDVIGSQTEIGSSDNSFVVNWNNNTKEANYNVTKVYGTLTVYQDKMKVFAEKKAEALSRLDILDEEFGTVISYRLIKSTKSEIGNMNYDESKTLEENIAAIEAINRSVEETVMRRHHFIYSCPFMTFMAQFLQPIFRFLVQLF